jgi:hypothetical protein
MFFLRTLIFVAAVVLLFYWLRSARSAKNTKPFKDAPPTQGLLRCTYCAVNFPASDAITVGGNVYCCEAHQIAAQQK